MKNLAEKVWVTEADLLAVVMYVGGRHRCGYVGVSKDHPLYGLSYSTPTALIKQEQVDSCAVGKKSPLLVLTATVNGDSGGTEIRRSLDVLVDVHGGITYSDSDAQYPIPSELWWFGFDCAHYDDKEEGGRSLEYCIAECESMAAQLQRIVA